MNNTIKNTLVLVVTIAIILTTFHISSYAGTSYDVNPSSTKPVFGVVNTQSTGLNVRASARTDSAIVGSLSRGSYVMIIGQVGSFYMVQYSLDKKYGFVAKSYINIGYSTQYAEIVADANFQSGNNDYSNRYCYIARRNYAPIIEYLASNAYDGWYHIVWGNTKGYVFSDWVKTHSY